MTTVSSSRTFFVETNVNAHIDVYLFKSLLKYGSTGAHCHTAIIIFLTHAG